MSKTMKVRQLVIKWPKDTSTFYNQELKTIKVKTRKKEKL